MTLLAQATWADLRALLNSFCSPSDDWGEQNLEFASLRSLPGALADGEPFQSTRMPQFPSFSLFLAQETALSGDEWRARPAGTGR